MVSSQAEDAAKTRAVSLQDCLQEALAHNLDLQIERITPQISLYNLRGSYAGWDPNFSISGAHNYSLSGGGLDPNTKLPSPASISDSDSFTTGLGGVLPWGTTYDLFGNISEAYGQISTNNFDNARGAIGINLTQPLLKNFLIDGTRFSIAVSKNRLKYSEQGLRGRVMDTVTSVEKAYYDLIAARENVKVQVKALQLADQLRSENKKRVEVGTLAPLDEKQSESQVAARRSDVLSARQVLAASQNALKSLLSDNYRQIHEVELEPTEAMAAPAQIFNVQDSWGKGLTQRPELIQAKLDAERQGIQLKYDRNRIFPELDLTGSYGHSAGGAGIAEFSQGFDQLERGNQPFYSYGARLTVPLNNRAARNSYKASKLANEQILLALKKTEQGILTQIDNAVIGARVSLERVGSTHEARRYAEAALDAEEKKLQNGKSTSFVVLQLQRDLTAARSEEIRALADYNKSLADLARSEGSTLDRRAINVEVK